MGLFWVSYAAVWVLLLAVSVGLLVLFRFVARTYRTHSPPEVGEIGAQYGPTLNTRVPVLELQDVAGHTVTLGRPRNGAQLILFAKSTCSRCRTAISFLRTFTSEQEGLETFVVCEGGADAIGDCASLVGAPLKAVADPEGKAAAWRIHRMPFGVVVDSSGFVRSRGDPTATAVLTIVGQVLERSREAHGSKTEVTEDNSLAHL